MKLEKIRSLFKDYVGFSFLMKLDLKPRVPNDLVVNNNKSFAIFHYTLTLFWNFGLAFDFLPCPATCGSVSHTNKLSKSFYPCIIKWICVLYGDNPGWAVWVWDQWNSLHLVNLGTPCPWRSTFRVNQRRKLGYDRLWVSIKDVFVIMIAYLFCAVRQVSKSQSFEVGIAS